MPKAKWKFAIGKTAGDLAAKTEAEKPVDVYMAVKAARLKEIEVSIGCPASTLSYADFGAAWTSAPGPHKRRLCMFWLTRGIP